eukprot:GHVO01052549.1.p1 GENE.GHVO01052549.1~~GHVO01052549.1.p1  ORF type:complete len:342 (-),score=39.06 GHVO01052549.1:138-1163(-)
MYSSASYNQNKSYALPQHPDDTPSCLAWTPSLMSPWHLAASSWDKTVRIWEVDKSPMGEIAAQPKALFTHQAPVLSCALSAEGALFAGGCDNIIKHHNLSTQQSQDIGSHDAPVSRLFWIPEKSLLVSGSWDNSVRFWDGRQQKAVATFNLPGKVYAMDVKYPVAAVACSDKNVYIYNLDGNLTTPVMTLPFAPLRAQARSISIFPDHRGYVLGSIEGRCAVQVFQDVEPKKSFAFRCHREGEARIFPVNAVDFHRKCGTFLTAGSDGNLFIWDRVNKHQLKKFDQSNAPITDAKFDMSGQLLAYSVGYDWHKGYSHAHPNKSPNAVMIHKINDEATPKPK